MKNMKVLLALGFLAANLGLAAQKTETRNLGSFQEIHVSGGYDLVTLREGSSESVAIEASGIDLDKIETKVEDGALKIGTKNGHYGNHKIKLVITFRSLKGISSSGSTDFVAESVIRGDEFEFSSSGSGDFKGELDVQKLRIAISGSSDMELRGKAEKQKIAISGSGDVDASKLKGAEAEVAISGSGDVDLNVSGKVRTSVSGSGDVENTH